MRSIRHRLLVLAFGATLFAVPGLADESNDYPPACDASKVSAADRERAHTVYISGKGFLEESNYDKAIGYFKDAYSIDCSVHGILPIIATAFERKGDKSEAVRALEEYTKRAPNAADHDVIERRIRNLKDQLAREPPAPTPAAPPSPSVAPAPPPAATEAVPPPPSPPPASMTASSAPAEAGHTAGPWIVTGVGGAAALAGVILFSVGTGDVSSADGECPDRSHCSSQSVVDTGNRGIQLKNAGGGLIAGGLVVAAAGLVWHFLERPTESAAATGSAPTLEPVAAPGYAGVSMRASF